MSVVCVGILGTGAVVRQFHLPALIAAPRATVTAVGNLGRQSLESLVKTYRIERAYTNFEQFARDPEIDAVIVALPNYLHAPVTRLMLQHGKHVLCEKPMAMTVAECRTMVDAAQVAARVLMIGHIWRCHSQIRWLRQVIESGRLGEIERVKAHAIVAGRGPDPNSWFVRRATAGGGALADVGIHGIDTISFLFGDRLQPAKITARIGNRFRSLEVEDSAEVHIEYNNGMSAEIQAGWYHDTAASPHGAIEIFGTKGYARTLPAECRDTTEPTAAESAPPNASAHPDDNQSVYATQIAHFLDCILENRRPECDGRQGLEDMMILESAYTAARTGAAVEFKSPAESSYGTSKG